MKCKQHPFERGPGVCAPCLRDRLLAILLEEAHSVSASAICSPSPSVAAAASSASARVLQGHNQQQHYARADSLPSEPPLAFPRSVSPYVSHRRSVDSGGVGSPFGQPRRRSARSLLFYSTPQIGPAGEGGVVTGSRGSKKRWSILSALFFGRSHRRGDPRSDGDNSFSDPATGASKASTEKPSSSSWFSWLGRSKSKRVRSSAAGDGGPYSFADASSGCKHPHHRRRSRHPRGMSPDTTSVAAEDDDDTTSDHDQDRSRHFTSSQHHSEYSTTTDFSSASPAWRIPGPTPLRKTPGGRHMSGFAVCLSPLVWASPGQQQRRSNQVALDGGCSGDLQPGRRGGGCHQPRHRQHGSDGAVLGPNRSRKLADLGTFR